MMNPASKTPPNRMSVIKINIGIGDSFLGESFLSFILATFFAAIKTSLKLLFGVFEKLIGQLPPSPHKETPPHEELPLDEAA